MAERPAAARGDSSPTALQTLGFYSRHFLVWLSLALVAYWAWLDHKILIAFEQRSWQLPARIYAAPLEIHRGLRLSPEAFARVLVELGYRAVREPSSPGQFVQHAQEFSIRTRGFVFADGPEAARALTVRFAAGQVGEITEQASHAEIGIARFEPLEIGRINLLQFEDRVLLGARELPPTFIRILLAVEDRRFYRHIGVDWLGIVRALWVNFRAGGIAQGGSTLTQQLIKNLYLERERTLSRKFNETLMALSLERHYSKNEILETYVNEVFLGQDGNRAIHGFGLAAKYYFGRPLNELSIPEAALLVGLVRGPSRYNPTKFPERALARRNVVLGILQEAAVISVAERDAFRALPLGLQTGSATASNRYAGFLDLVRRQLQRDYQVADLQTAGLKVFTTLDIIAQLAAEAAINQVLPSLEHGRTRAAHPLEAAAVITDARTADIKALIGGRNFISGGFNRALDAQRQIGSLIKPFVYLTALAQLPGFNVASQLNDAPRTWSDHGKEWAPKNYDGKYFGAVHAQDALAHSLNLATVDLGFRIGPQAVRKTLNRCGFNGEIPQYPALFLGAMEMSPYDITQLYQVIANDGFRIPLRSVSAVIDSHNQPIKRYALHVERVVDAASVFLVRYLLTRVVEFGTARAVAHDFAEHLPLAGKTGTTNDARDSWFVGFSGEDLAAVWIGRDDNASAGLTGAAGALKVWSEIMKRIGVRPISMDPPPTVEWHWVTADGHALSAPGCAGALWVPLNLDHLPASVESCPEVPTIAAPQPLPFGQ